MADLSITPADVVPGTQSRRSTLIAAVAISAGQAVYINASNQLALADCSADTTAGAVGIAVNSCAPGQPCTFHAEGDLEVGSVITAGTIYVLSATAGGIAPATDLASTNLVTILGVGIDATSIQVGIQATGIEVA